MTYNDFETSNNSFSSKWHLSTSSTTVFNLNSQLISQKWYKKTNSKLVGIKKTPKISLKNSKILHWYWKNHFRYPWLTLNYFKPYYNLFFNFKNES